MKSTTVNPKLTCAAEYKNFDAFVVTASFDLIEKQDGGWQIGLKFKESRILLREKYV